MAISNTFSSGVNTDFSTELNTNFDEVIIHRKIFNESTELTHTGDTDFTAVGSTFNLVAPTNSLLLGVRMNAQLKNSNGSELTSACLRFNATNLGAKYLVISPSVNDAADNRTSVRFDDEAGNLVGETGSSYVDKEANCFIPTKLLDDTTEIDIYLRTSDGAETAFIDEITIECLYTKAFAED